MYRCYLSLSLSLSPSVSDACLQNNMMGGEKFTGTSVLGFLFADEKTVPKVSGLGGGTGISTTSSKPTPRVLGTTLMLAYPEHLGMCW